MRIQEKKEFIIDVTYYSLILILAYLVTKYFLGVLFPFVFGFFIAFALRPVIKFVSKKLKVNNKIVSLIILLLFYTLIGTGIFFAVLKVISMLKTLFEEFPEMFATNIQPIANQLSEWLKNIASKINPEIFDFVSQFDKSILEQVNNFVKNFSSAALSFLSNVVTKIPSFFLAFFFTIISSFLISLDYEKITDFLNYQISGRGRRLFEGIQSNGVKVIVNFLKAYGILLSVTFVETAIGLTILRVDNAIGIAVIVAIVDILPVLGTGTILIPWAIVSMINGRFTLGIGLFVLYAIITVIRQVLEPRIVGDSIGLYPLITLISMYLGTLYFGIIGLFAIPIIVTIFVKLQDDEIISFYRDPNKKVEEK